MADSKNAGDTFEDTGELNVSRGGRRVWLVKVPQFLADAWKQAGPDAELGKVRVSQAGPAAEVIDSPLCGFSVFSQVGLALVGNHSQRADGSQSSSGLYAPLDLRFQPRVYILRG